MVAAVIAVITISRNGAAVAQRRSRVARKAAVDQQPVASLDAASKNMASRAVQAMIQGETTTPMMMTPA